MFRRISLVLAIAATLPAQDWPQWRGPRRDGVLAGWTAPKSWPEKLIRRWTVTAGEGYSSPVLAGGKIYQFARQGEQETLMAIDPVDGKVLWRQSYAAPYQMNPAAMRHGKGPKSTPAVSGGTVCTLGIQGTLACWDAATGRLRWRKDFNASPLYGTSTSPVIDSGLLIAHTGGNDGGALSAFDPQTGAVKWSWNGDGPAYASPIVTEFAGVRQVVTQTQSNIVGLAATTGELLWRMPFTTPFVQNIVTPVAWHDTLLLGGLQNPTFAVRVSKTAKGWSAERLWENKDVPMYMSSPVLAGDLLFGFSNRNRGMFYCLDPASGKALWTGEPRQGDNAAIVRGGDTLLLLTSDAELVVARASPKSFEAVRKYHVADSPTYAHPLMLNHGVVVKDAQSLTLWSWE